MSLESLMLKHIRLDGDTQPRVEMSPELVEEYAEDMAAGVEFPPIAVMFDGTDHWLYDGFHRYHAAMQIGKERIAAEVKEGTKKEAVWESLGANKSHGMRRMNCDKVNAVHRGLRLFPRETDGSIARHVGVVDSTVRRQRIKLQSLTGKLMKDSVQAKPELVNWVSNPTEEIPQLARRRGADGKWYPLNRKRPIIGPDRRPAAPRVDDEDLDEMDRDVLGRPFTGPHAGKLRDAFADRPGIVQDVDWLLAMAIDTSHRIDKPDSIYRHLDFPRFHAGVRQAAETLARICPHSVCPDCLGAGCPACDQRGWIDEWKCTMEPQRQPDAPAKENERPGGKTAAEK